MQGDVPHCNPGGFSGFPGGGQPQPGPPGPPAGGFPQAPAAGVPNGKGPRPHMPSPFKGKQGKAWEAFKTSVNMCLAVNAITFTGNHQKMCWVLSYLKGDATFWIRNNQDIANNPTHYFPNMHTFWEFLDCNFANLNKINKARAKLLKITQKGPLSNIDDFIREFKQLAMEARYTEGSYLVLCFKNGLAVELMAQVEGWGANKDDINNWIEKAQRANDVEAHISEGKSSSRHTTLSIPQKFTSCSTNTSNSAPPKDPDTMDIDATRVKIPDWLAKEKYTERVCINCGKKGHMKGECRSPTNPKQFQPQQVAAQAKDDEEDLPNLPLYPNNPSEKE